MNFTTIREALAANLAPLEPDWQVSPYILDNPTPPTIQIFPTETIYDLTMKRGLDEVGMTIQAIVALTSDIAAQQLLDSAMDSASLTGVKALIDGTPADSTLGGLVNTLTVNTMTGPRLVSGPSPPWLVTDWTIVLYPNGE